MKKLTLQEKRVKSLEVIENRQEIIRGIREAIKEAMNDPKLNEKTKQEYRKNLFESIVEWEKDIAWHQENIKKVDSLLLSENP